MTSTDTDRLAEIKRRAKHQKMLDRSLRTVRAKDHVAAVDDRDFLLSLVEQLQKQVESDRKDVALLMALEAEGVDNWVGYEDAVEAAKVLGLGEGADDAM